MNVCGLWYTPEGIVYPIILGIDAAGTLEDGTPVAIYPLMGGDDWRGDETLDPGWHIPSEFVHGTFADYAVVPRRNALPLPGSLSPLHASVLGTAWLTAYRALFTKSGLRAGETVLIQGATGGMATALIQLGRAAGFEVWVTGRTEEGRVRAKTLGAHQTFSPGEALPRKVPAVVDSVGAETLTGLLRTMASHGTVALCGLAGGVALSATVLPFILRGVNLCGIDSVKVANAERRRVWERIVQDLPLGLLDSMTQTKPLSEIFELGAAILAGQVRGRTVIDVNQ